MRQSVAKKGSSNEQTVNWIISASDQSKDVGDAAYWRGVFETIGRLKDWLKCSSCFLLVTQESGMYYPC